MYLEGKVSGQTCKCTTHLQPINANSLALELPPRTARGEDAKGNTKKAKERKSREKKVGPNQAAVEESH